MVSHSNHIQQVRPLNRDLIHKVQHYGKTRIMISTSKMKLNHEQITLLELKIQIWTLVIVFKQHLLLKLQRSSHLHLLQLTDGKHLN